MISFIAILLVVTVLLLAMMQTVLVINYRWFLRDASPAGLGEDDDLPKAAIILCLRGQDDGIADCLAELVGQDYPDFELHVAFDSPQDPAVQQVQEFFTDHTASAQLHFFEPQANCSYKCSGIVHVLGKLGDDVSMVAFCDGDAVIDINWLRDLVTPMMSDEKIGATTGNRWFQPEKASTGGLVRKHWNAAAIVQMQAYDIAWGGSMAVRRNVIEQCGMMEIWSKSFCEDTSLAVALSSNGLRLHRVANLIIENTESSTWRECFHWIARQMLTLRLHHPGWPLVLGHGIITGVATIVAPIVAIILLVSGNFFAGRSLLIACLVYQVLNVALLMLIEHCNRDAIAQRNPASKNPAAKPPLRLRIWSLFMVQVLHPLAVVDAMKMKSVEWCGVNYQLNGNQIRVADSHDAALETASDGA